MRISRIVGGVTAFVFLMTTFLWMFPAVSYADVTGDDFGKKLVFEYNEELFAMYAYLNYTGYTEDNYTVHDPIRQGVIDDLNAMNLNLSNPAPGYTKSGMDKYYYDLYMHCISGPPEFAENQLWINSVYGNDYYGQQLRSLGIHDALVEFYNEADIHNLYLKYEAGYMKEINRLKNITNDDCAMLFNTFHMDINKMSGQIYVDANFLMPRGRGETWLATDPSRNDGYVIAYGPNYENLVDSSMIIHELLHHYVNPIMDKYPDKVQAFIKANDVVPGGPYSKETMVTESFIRGMQDIPHDYCRNDDSIPFPMMFKIFDYYKTNYDPATGDLESFIVDALDYYSQEGITSTLAADPSEVDLVQGGSGRQVTMYAVLPDGQRNDVTAECTYRMADSAIARVNGGYVIPVSSGDTVMTVSYEHADPITVNIHVSKKNTVIRADHDSLSLTVGGQGVQVKVNATDGDGHVTDVTANCEYSVDPENIVSVAKGLVTPLGAGKALLTIAYGDADPIEMDVQVGMPLPKKIAVSPRSIKINQGDTTAIDVLGYYTGSSQAVNVNDLAVFASSKPAVCTVNADGTVSGIKKGTAKITVKVGKLKKTISVKVL